MTERSFDPKNPITWRDRQEFIISREFQAGDKLVIISPSDGRHDFTLLDPTAPCVQGSGGEGELVARVHLKASRYLGETAPVTNAEVALANHFNFDGDVVPYWLHAGTAKQTRYEITIIESLTIVRAGRAYRVY